MGINWILLSEVFRNIAYGISALVYAYVTLVNMWWKFINVLTFISFFRRFYPNFSKNIKKYDIVIPSPFSYIFFVFHWTTPTYKKCELPDSARTTVYPEEYIRLTLSPQA